MFPTLACLTACIITVLNCSPIFRYFKLKRKKKVNLAVLSDGNLWFICYSSAFIQCYYFINKHFKHMNFIHKSSVFCLPENSHFSPFLHQLSMLFPSKSNTSLFSELSIKSLCLTIIFPTLLQFPISMLSV